MGNNDFFVGNQVTIADLALFHMIDNFVKPLAGDVLRAHTTLENWRQRVAALPRIQAYLNSDRRPVITMPPMWKILCTPEECK